MNSQQEDQWQKAVTRLAENRELRQATEEECRAYVERSYTWKMTVDVMLDVIDRALNGRRAMGTID